MERRSKDIVNLALHAGLEPVKAWRDGSRTRLTARAPNGVTREFSVTTSLRSDVRGDLNECSAMKRFARENQAPHAVPTATVAAPACEAPPTTTAPAPTKRIVMKSALPRTAPAPSAAPAPVADKAPAAETPQPKELLPAEFFRLGMWLKKQDLTKIPSFDALAMLASREHGMPVADGTVRELMEATETVEPEHWKAPSDPTSILARELASFMKSLGAEPSAALAKLAAA